MAKHIKTLTFLLLCVLPLSGCGAKRIDVSREDWKIKTYEGIPKQKIVNAAREVLRLADEDETHFESTHSGFTAFRYQPSYIVVQTKAYRFLYEFVAHEVDGKVDTRIDVDEQILTANVLTLGLPVINVGKPESSYFYDLFYSRLDYLLGLQNTWYTCEKAISRIGAEYGKTDDVFELGLSSLCGEYVDDRVPPQINLNSSDNIFSK